MVETEKVMDQQTPEGYTDASMETEANSGNEKAPSEVRSKCTSSSFQSSVVCAAFKARASAEAARAKMAFVHKQLAMRKEKARLEQERATVWWKQVLKLWKWKKKLLLL